MSIEGGGDSGGLERQLLRRHYTNLWEIKTRAIDFLFQHEADTEEETVAFTNVAECIKETERVISELDDVIERRKEQSATLPDESIQARNHLNEALEDAQRILNKREHLGDLE